MLSGPPASATASAEQLLERVASSSARQRRSLLPQFDARTGELRPLLLDALESFDPAGDDWVAGLLIQALLSQDDSHSAAFRARHPNGWLAVSSACGIDHAPLQEALAQGSYELADRLTSALLRDLAGPEACRRGYVYYSEVAPIPAVDLTSLDRLWVTYSRGRFGFSVQGRLLRACNGRWEQLWPKLGWKRDGTWTRYPSAFQWNLEAPEGHMPLVNQLRGVRLMDALLRHPALQQRTSATPGTGTPER
jgi:hypothetical protein